jgi:hypothetical protein
METIKETISRLMHELGSRQKNSRSDEISAWLENALSTKERKHISSCSEHKGALRLKVDSSSWIYHLNLKKETLLNGIRQHLPHITEIRFSISKKNEKTQNKRTQTR